MEYKTKEIFEGLLRKETLSAAPGIIFFADLHLRQLSPTVHRLARASVSGR